MKYQLRRGFKADAERLAFSIRAELGLRAVEPIECESLCEHFEIPIVTVSNLVAFGASQGSIRCILSSRSNFSAMTVAHGSKRLIVYNPRHPVGRRRIRWHTSFLIFCLSTRYPRHWVKGDVGTGTPSLRPRRIGRRRHSLFQESLHWLGCGRAARFQMVRLSLE